MTEKEEILNKFQYCIRKCSYSRKELLPFLDLMQYRPVDTKFATIRINVRDSTFIYFEYNPKWVVQIHKDILLYFMYVEAMKIILHHPTRLGFVGNVAAKIAASNVTASLDIPAHSSFKSTVQDIDWFNKTCNVNLSQNELTFEIAYKILNRSKYSQPPMNFGTSQNIPIDGQSGNPNSNEEGSGNKSNKSDKHSQSENKEKFSQRELIEMHYNVTNQLWQSQAYGENLIVDDQITREFEANGGISSFSGGYSQTGYNSNTRKMIINANSYSADVTSILRRYAADVKTTNVEYSRMRYNRRYGLRLPGYKYLYQSKVGICFDRSGSMDNMEDVECAVGIINSFIPHSEVWYCEWDTKCHGFTKLRKQFTTVSKEGGGTDPDCVIQYINEHHLKFNGLIFITDNGFSWKRPNIASKISILGTKDSCKCPEWCRYFFPMAEILKVKL